MTELDLVLWTLIGMRVTGFVLMNPILSRRGMPGIVRAGIVMVLSVFLITYQGGETVAVGSMLEYAVLLLKELTVGVVTGFVVSLFQYVVLFAGTVSDFMMGMSMATIYDPQSNSSAPLTATFLNYMFMLLFFAVNGHVALFHLLIDLREIIPYGSVTLNPDAFSLSVGLFASCTVLGLQMAFPILAVELLAEVGVGILMRTIPQINIFAINIQMKILVGLVALLILIMPFGDFTQSLIASMNRELRAVLALLGG